MSGGCKRTAISLVLVQGITALSWFFIFPELPFVSAPSLHHEKGAEIDIFCVTRSTQRRLPARWNQPGELRSSAPLWTTLSR